MSWLARLWNSVRRRDLRDDIDEELQFHIDARMRDNVAAGLSREEARRDAVMRFGNPAAIREQTQDANLAVWLETTLRDLAIAVRSFRKHPMVAATALLTLALGIGANTAIFTMVRSVLLRPLPFPEPERLYVISYSEPDSPFWLYPGMPDRHYLQFQEDNRWFESVATFSTPLATLTGAGDATRVVRAVVTPDFFRVLAVRPVTGRDFAGEDALPGHGTVALISHELWRTRFGSNASVLNRTIALDGVPHRLVGVLPPGFAYPASADVWTPLAVEIKPNVGYTRPMIGRLARGISEAEAQAGFEAVARRFSDEPDQRARARLTPLQEAIVGDVKLPLLVFSGAVVCVLLIACANVANLLLMRAVSRRHEIATRCALGAGRARIVRHLLTEAALLSFAGALLGAALAFFAEPLLRQLIPADMLPKELAIRMDGWVLGFTLAVSIAVGLLVGLAPAFHATREGANLAFRATHATASPRSTYVRQALVIAEVALALVLLIGAALLGKSFLGLLAIDTGFDPAQVMTMTVDVPEARYKSVPEVKRFHEELLGSLTRLPEVSAAGLVNWLPLGTMVIRGDLVTKGGAGKGWATKAGVSAGYFRAMGIRLLAGREFGDRDSASGAGAAIVSESLARRIWPDENALGKQLSIESQPGPQDWLTVVGVVADVRQGGLTEAVMPTVYQPFQQVRRRAFLDHATFVIRTSGEPSTLAPVMRSILKAHDPDLAPISVAAMVDLVARTIAEPEFQTRLLGAFSLVALGLAALGIYGVMASAVVERRREIGIRVALGAGRSDVIGMVLQRTVLLAAAGVALGLVASLLLTDALATLLFNVTPTDPVTFASAAAVLAGIAVLAAVFPACRASSVDPVVVLRAE